MSEKDKNQAEPMPEEIEDLESEFFTMIDEESGQEIRFELIGSTEMNGTVYHAMIPVDDQPEEEDVYEYVILKEIKDENGDTIFATIDDDDEQEDVAERFDDMFSDEADYDINDGGN